MEIEAHIHRMKDIHTALIDYIDATDDSDAIFNKLSGILEKQEILKDQEEIRLLFLLISKIADHHHRPPDFLNKLDKIFQYLIKDNSSPITNFITDYNNYNIFLLYHLFEKKYIKPDDQFITDYLGRKPHHKKLSRRTHSKFQHYYYLYPALKEYIKESQQKQIEEEISEKFEKDLSKFEKKCQQGENDTEICAIIREGSVDKFSAYIKSAQISTSEKVQTSLFETNVFLASEKPTMIEYASFYGSLEIVQYLKKNNVPLTFSLWLYGVHSNDIEFIHFLEANKNTNKAEEPFDDVFIESINCHHTKVSEHIKGILMKQYDGDFIDYFSDEIYCSLNFFYFPNEISSLICNQRNGRGFFLSQLLFSLTKVSIPDSVTKIANGSFKGCSNLNEITIPSSVTKIEDYAFYFCSNLKKISIPDSVTEIGDYLFVGCSSLTDVIIPSSLSEIGNDTFNGCLSLKQISIPDSVTKIGDYCFNNCSNLTQINIPFSVIKIGDYAFSMCSSVEGLIIPSSVEEIGSFSFSDCLRMKFVLFQNLASLKSIGSCAFLGCSLISEDSIKSIYDNLSNKKVDVAKSNSSSKWGAFKKDNTTSSWGEKPIQTNLVKILLNEFEIIRLFDHPNVIKAFGIIFNNDKSPLILYEEYPINIKQAIENKKLSRVQLVYSIYQIATGMKYIHSCKIMHLNLSLTNILLSDDGTIKITDFKNAKKMVDENEEGEMNDVYSFGEIAYFILSGKELKNSDKQKVLSSFSLLAQQLIEACFYDDLECRSTFEMICDVLDQNNFDLVSFSQQESEEVSKLIAQYKKLISH